MTQLYINWNVDPEIFNISGFSIKYYGLLFIIGLIISYKIIKKIYRKEDFDAKAHEALFIYSIIGMFLGARLGHVLFYDFEYYSRNVIEIFLPVQRNEEGSYYFSGYAGLASHGGAIGLLLALIFYSGKHKISLLKVLDIVAIVAALAGMFIRIANLMNSEMIGIPSNLPWAFVFKKVDDIPRHPSQLYEAASYLLIFVVLYFVYKRGKIDPGNGFYFGLSLFLIFLMRILIEFTKIDQVDFEEGMLLNMGQILSIPFVLVGIFMVIKSYKGIKSIPYN